MLGHHPHSAFWETPGAGCTFPFRGVVIREDHKRKQSRGEEAWAASLWDWRVTLLTSEWVARS